ncbi:Transcriptional regulator, TetR family [Salinisphaera sp. LB1]|nr:Transcriptional regulator, TetR family [Salinisphaera sp. LB1]
MRAGEALFSQSGFRGVSMRDIAKAADTQVGSITYHFESKEGLLLSIYRRNCGPMNERRAELLREAERIKDIDQRLEAIVRAWVLPALSSNADLVGGGARFARLRAKMSAEGNEAVRDVIATIFDETSHALIDAIGRCLPALARPTIVWRCHFLLGALYYTLIDPDRINRLSQGEADGNDMKEALEQLVMATVGMLRS